MLELSNDDRKELRKAIESAYPGPDDLRLFIREELDENLASIAGSGIPYTTIAFNLVDSVIADGRTDDLILAIHRDKPNRLDIQQFCKRVLRQRLVLSPSADAVDELSITLDPTLWDLDVQSANLEGFLPTQFSFEADVGTLLRGLALANAVCKITFSDRSPAESGTGVLIAPDLVLTNYHVLSRAADADLDALAQTAQFEFGYVSTDFGEARRTYRLTAAPQASVVASSPIEVLDFALIRLSPGADFAVQPVPLNATAQLVPRSPLHILQHPEGEALKVSLSNNGVVKINQPKGLVLYVNPTRGGSSGSPCFDDQWRLVALHHKGMQTSFGSVREGILISAIYPHISSMLLVN